jgi:hypothetical protein
VDEVDLRRLSVGHDVQERAVFETGRGTHAVGKVRNQVLHFDIADLDFTVQPGVEG